MGSAGANQGTKVTTAHYGMTMLIHAHLFASKSMDAVIIPIVAVPYVSEMRTKIKEDVANAEHTGQEATVRSGLELALQTVKCVQIILNVWSA